MAMNSDGSIVITVDLNDKDYESRLSSMENKTQSFGTQVKSLLTAVGVTKAISVGFNMVRDSIGSAMDRIDTMNQFNRVMTVMTGSTEQAKEALNELKGITKGTGYGLDVAASSTQKLVTSGMDLSRAVPQIATWGDAVAFYGDGSNQTFANVTDAISKMTSKGKVEMDQLNRLFDSGIPAVEIYASYVDRSTAEVQEDLSNGVISAQEFTDGLTTAMRDGTDRFASIDGAAKEAGASWSATFDNMKAAVTRGMVNIIESIDQALTDNGLPTMREMIADVGKAFETVMSSIAEHMPEIISVIQTLLPVIISVGTGFLGWKVVTFIQGVPAMITSVTKAVTALNAAMAANPIGVVVTLIAALVAAFIYFWNTSEDFRQFWYDLWDGIVSFFSSIVNKIKTFFTTTIPQAWEDFKTKLGELGENIKLMFENAWNSVISFFTETIPAWIQSVIEWFQMIPYNIGVIVGKIIGFFYQWGQNLISFVTEDVPAFFSAIGTWFSELPGKIGAWVGEAWEKIKEWGANFVREGNERAEGFVNGIVNFIKELPGKVGAWLNDVWTKVKEWGANFIQEGNQRAEGFVNGIIDFLKELPGKVVDIGKDIVRGIWDGICSAASWLGDQISGFCNGVVDGFTSVTGFDIRSPSRKMRDMIGKFLPPGIAVGFELAMPDAESDMKKSANNMIDGLKKEIDIAGSQLSTGVNLEQNASVSRQTSIINQFPKNFTLSGNTSQPVYLVLSNGTELAHAIIEPINKELALQ